MSAVLQITCEKRLHTFHGKQASDVAVLKELLSIGGASDVIWPFLEELVNSGRGGDDDDGERANISFILFTVLPVKTSG
jgi:hypothetical protein